MTFWKTYLGFFLFRKKLRLLLETNNMKKIILSTLLIGSLLACNEQVNKDGEIERVFFENANLSPSDNAGVYPFWNKGEHTIFRFTFKHPDEPNIADDELSEIFWIEIPAHLNSFEVNADASDSGIEVYYTRACYCYIPNAFEFDQLDVTGTKISEDQWTISFEMKVSGEYGTYTLEDSGNYNIDFFSHD